MTIEAITNGATAVSLSALRKSQQSAEPSGPVQAKESEPARKGAEKPAKVDPPAPPKLDEKVLEQIKKDLDLSSVGREYRVIDKLGRVYVRLYDKETGEMIREIPAEKLLRVAKVLEAVSGALFEKVV